MTTSNQTPQHHVIKETSDSLTRLFQDEFKRNGYKRVHIVDGAPKPDVIEGKLPAVSVYLYQIALDPVGFENTAIHEVVEVKDEEGAIKEYLRRRRLWVRLDYLISAWAQTPEDEQLLCGLVLRTIIDNAEISKERLKGTTFDESMSQYDFTGLPLNLNTRLEEGALARFWGSLNQPVRPAIQCWTTVPIIPEKMSEFQRVRARQLEYRNIHDPKVKEQGPNPNPFSRRLDLGGGGRKGGGQ
ncbi:MAG: Pvc16 family protein [Kofleriaceae bacterium]